MIVKPKVRGFICTTAHPKGCEQHVLEQIKYVQSQKQIQGSPKKVLIIGSSTGYGLATRVVAAFGGGQADTMGVFFERPAEGKRTATAGWYNSVGFDKLATEAGMYARSFNGDAFSDEMKQEVIDAIKRDWGGVDLVIYSLASPRRKHPKTGHVSKSVLKPIGQELVSQTLNLASMSLESVTLEQATQEEVDETVAVMGGEDWAMWIDALDQAGLLNEGMQTVAYSYVGPEITQAVYRNGTIGQAKKHLESTTKMLNETLKKINGKAMISVNKALVTQSSSAIPVIPLYFVILNKVMKGKNIYEDCIMQIFRLFSDFLCTDGELKIDDEGLIRLDDLETREDVQADVMKTWGMITNENLYDVADIDGYKKEFMKLFGFGLDGVDYEADVETALLLK